ncbi:hypothetical protein [Flavobacterium adhaerens]|uniref:hypothetical protein n=1 Tax=Flavobacterium adhaerens TaxID=3149043 RepID=UPI0032B31FDB
MKKKLEADLISIAHRILQLKNKSDINQLYLETQKLYEKLAVLRFVEEHFEEAKPTIGQTEVIEKIDAFFEIPLVTAIETITEETPIVTEIIANETPVIEEISQPLITSENTEVVEEPDVVSETTPITNEESAIISEKIAFEPIVEAIETVSAEPEFQKKKEAVQISFDDLLGGKYTDPQFVKVSPSDKKLESESVTPIPSFEIQKENTTVSPTTAFAKEESKTITLNDKLAKEIAIGLNDRIAFVKHLFGGSNEDYNRVVSQLITFDNYPETKAFIDQMVKPDYNNWEGKEDYEHRFMEIIEKKFLAF